MKHINGENIFLRMAWLNIFFNRCRVMYMHIYNEYMIGKAKMRKRDLKEYYYVLNGKEENRYKYTYRRICYRRRAYYYLLSDMESDEKLRELLPENTGAIVWAEEYFATEFFKAQNLNDLKPVKISVQRFYREVLTPLIKKKANVLICPNTQGEGRVMTAKEFKITLFLEFYEREGESWMLN